MADRFVRLRRKQVAADTVGLHQIMLFKGGGMRYNRRRKVWEKRHAGFV